MIRRVLAVGALVVAGASALAAPAGAVDGTAAGAPQGNATPTLQTSSGVAVVATSAPTDGRVAVILHNATTHAVRILRVDVIATSADGGSATRVHVTATYPQVLAPDTLALTAVSFGPQRAPAADATFDAKVRSRRVSTAGAARTLSVAGLHLSAIQTGAVAQTMTASLTNGTAPSWTARHPAAAVVCFGEGGNPSTFATAKPNATKIAPGASAPVTVPLTSLCPTYLVAARAS